MMTVLPIVSTSQISHLFSNRQPNKRASECLHELEGEGMIEGKRREIGKDKVWRLSNKGRKHVDVDRTPVPFSSRQLEHYLEIGNVCMYLKKKYGKRLQFFEVEPRYPYVVEGETTTYCPDGFFVIERKPYLLEVQLSSLSVKRWIMKWKSTLRFFTHNGKIMNQSIRPTMIVLTNQKEENAKSGYMYQILVIDQIEKFDSR